MSEPSESRSEPIRVASIVASGSDASPGDDSPPRIDSEHPGGHLGAIGIDHGTGNSIRGNSIHDNGIAHGLPGGIYLNTASNANDNQAAPVLTSAVVSASTTIVSGTLDSVPDTSFAIDFYANTGFDPAGFLEGQTYLGSTTITTDGSGNATFTAAVAVPPSGQSMFTATATNLSTGAGALIALGVVAFFAVPRLPLLLTAAAGWLAALLARARTSLRPAQLKCDLQTQ